MLRHHNLRGVTRNTILTAIVLTLSLILAGTHDFILSAAPKKTSTAKEKEVAKKPIKLNLNEAEMGEFLKMMSDIIGKNIITNDQVRGKITIISSKGIPPEEAYNLMKSILEIKGFAVVEMDNVIKIIPVTDAIQKNTEVIIDGQPINPNSENAITYLYEVKNASLDDMNNVLNNLKTIKTRIIIYRTLNILVLSGIASEINGLVNVAKMLDKKVEVPEADGSTKEVNMQGNIHVVHLENAKAEDLANVLSRVPFSQFAKIQQQQQQQAPPVPIQQQINPSGQVNRNVGAQASQQPQIPLSIIASKETNSLIVTAAPDEFEEILNIIKKLDIVRDQILIEALIVEVSAENGWGFGIDWMLGKTGGGGVYGGSQILGSAPNYTDPTNSGKKLAVPLQNGFQIGYLSDRATLGFALLSASATDNNFNILSTPQILATDNQESEINVGTMIPVPTNNRVASDGSQTYSYDYKEVGLKFKLTPHKTKEKNVTLDLYMEVNSVQGTTTATTGGAYVPPSLNKRDLKTKVSVDDGQTIVVGGLIQNNKSDMVTKVPVLGDIPILGWLFKRKTVENKKSNLLVFITPRIVTLKERLDEITEQKTKEQDMLRRK